MNVNRLKNGTVPLNGIAFELIRSDQGPYLSPQIIGEASTHMQAQLHSSVIALAEPCMSQLWLQEESLFRFF
jgi:hypothetical protein